MTQQFGEGGLTMKYRCWLLIIFLGFSVFGCAKGGTYSLKVRYEPFKELPSLRQKLGLTLGIAPFKDERPETLYIGFYSPLMGTTSYFKSEPFPLEKAIEESLSQILSRYDVKIVPVRSWDGKPESLKKMNTDSILMVEIKSFWVEGTGSLFRADLRTSVRLLIHLGVKKEGEVFTRNMEVEKEMTVASLTPERMEQAVNQILTEIFDSFFSNPY